MATLNGWQRLWVVVTVFWEVAVLSVSYVNWPTPSASLREHVQITLMFWVIPPVFL